MANLTLAAGQITNSDRLTVELHQPPDTPAFVLIVWPGQPTPVPSVLYTEVAAAAMKVLAEASTVLAAIRAKRRM
jgi:hypothetical protein